MTTIDHPEIMYQAVGGKDKTAKGFEEALKNTIKYNAEVLELRQDESGVRIPYKDTLTGEVKVEKADYCITTIPVGILAKQETDLRNYKKQWLPPERAVGKLILQMNDDFGKKMTTLWQIQLNRNNGHTVIYPSYGYCGKKGVIQSVYAFGPVALKLGRLNLNEQVKQAVERLEKIHPGQFEKHYDNKASQLHGITQNTVKQDGQYGHFQQDKNTYLFSENHKVITLQGIKLAILRDGR